MDKTCKHCGTTFDAELPQQRYCSEYCKRRHDYEKHRDNILAVKRARRAAERTVTVRACERCGSCVPMKDGQKFCSKVCKVRAKNDRAYSTDKYKARAKRYRETDNGKLHLALGHAKRRAREAGSERTLTAREWLSAVSHFGGRCAYCGTPLPIKEAHKEHFWPLSLGGGFTKANIVPSCSDCNVSKLATPPLDWLVQRDHGLVTYAKITAYLERP